MVRIKTRWLLIRIDNVNNLDDGAENEAVGFPSKNELARVIRDNLIQCSGVAASGAAFDTQGMSTSVGDVDRKVWMYVTYRRTDERIRSLPSYQLTVSIFVFHINEHME
jgi:hypothetical protein